jgi:hypothetical protein
MLQFPLPGDVKFLIPSFPLQLVPRMLGLSVAGGIVAGLYGVAHDQITYTLAPEYFTRLKFQQFAWADLGLPPRVFAAQIGFIASWWVGFFSAWFLARIAVPAWPKEIANRKAWIGFAQIFGATVVGGIGGGLLGSLPGAAGPDWQDVALELGIRDVPAFVQVAFIHNGSYVGGGIGLVLSLLSMRRQRPSGPNPS